MEQIRYKEKYLKYKKKYLSLKERNKELNSEKIDTFVEKDGRFKYNKLVLINFNDKIGGGQYKFNIIDNQDNSYNLYMWDKSKEYEKSDFIRELITSNQNDFNQENWTFSGSYDRAHESISNILDYDYACFLTDPDYTYTSGKEKIIGYIKASKKISTSTIANHIYIDYVELRKQTTPANPSGQGKGLCKPMLGRFIQWLYVDYHHTLFKIFNASSFGQTARNCYTTAYIDQYSHEKELTYTYGFGDNWDSDAIPKDLAVGEAGNENIFIQVDEMYFEGWKFSLIYSAFATLYTYQDFKTWFGDDYVHDKWEMALPEYRYSTVQGYGDKLYSWDDFKSHWGDQAQEQWDKARQIQPDDSKLDGSKQYTLLEFMQYYGQRNGIKCWNGEDCNIGDPQLELRYTRDNILYSFTEFQNNGIIAQWNRARRNNIKSY